MTSVPSSGTDKQALGAPESPGPVTTKACHSEAQLTSVKAGTCLPGAGTEATVTQQASRTAQSIRHTALSLLRAPAPPATDKGQGQGWREVHTSQSVLRLSPGTTDWWAWHSVAPGGTCPAPHMHAGRRFPAGNLHNILCKLISASDNDLDIAWSAEAAVTTLSNHILNYVSLYRKVLQKHTDMKSVCCCPTANHLTSFPA